MSPFLFNLYLDGIVMEALARTLGRGAKLVGAGEKKWEVSQLQFADDTVLIAEARRS